MKPTLFVLALAIFASYGASACQLRVSASLTELSHPSPVETIAVATVSLRNDGNSSCLPRQFRGPGLLLNASGSPGTSASPASNPFRVESARDFSETADCGGAGAQMDRQAMCTWSEIQPGQTVVMRAEFRAPESVARPFCFDGVVFLDGARGLFLVAQPIAAGFSTCPAPSPQQRAAANEAAAYRSTVTTKEIQ